MIRIVLNSTGNDLDLTETTLRWESVNTLFEDNALQSDYSFPFILKYSDTNMRELGFAHKADVPNASVTFPITLFLGSKSIKSNLIINGTDEKGFNTNIAAGITGLVNADKKLSELNYKPETEGIIDLGVGFGEMAIFQDVDWRLAIAFPPHYNPDFYGDTNPDFCGIVNRMDATVGNFLLNTTYTDNKYALVPFLYKHFIIKTICDENGLTPTGDYWMDAEHASALLYNNYALDKAEDQGAIVKTGYDRTWTWNSVWNLVSGVLLVSHSPATSIIIRFADYFPGCSNLEGNFHNSDYKYYVPTAGDYAAKFPVSIYTSAGYSRSAQIQIIYKYGGVETVIGSEDYTSTTTGGIRTFNVLGVITGASSGGEIFARLLNTTGDVFAPNTVDTYYGPGLSIDWTVKYDGIITIYRYDTSFNIMDRYVKLQNHLPDITVSEFLNALKNRAQCEINIDWDERTLSMTLAEKTIASTPAINLTDLADPNYTQIFDEKSKGYTLNYDFGGNDGLLTDNFKPYDKTKIIGEYIKKSLLPTAAPIDALAIVKNKNKLMKWSGAAWVEYSDYYYPITVGKGARERKIELAPMLMTDAQVNESATSNSADVICIMPAISETGSSPLFDLGINAPSLRTVFMRGKITGTYGGNYIYASSTNYDVNGNKIGEYTLKMEGDDGWFKRYLEKIFLAIDNSGVFEFKIKLPTSYLKYKGKVQIKNVNYLVKNVSMILGSTIKQSVVKLLKL
ncbi:MAG: hypothetical protein A3F72_02865 [Bacteroidetes bacterium RIFCSPLOWO2_12_FULL_35_15]|nr:MAG: hypothetical protein A3F72_02865 [Bacteroidetes bacterium RIFCSPLOWO2_12_FULL_35_15]